MCVLGYTQEIKRNTLKNFVQLLHYYHSGRDYGQISVAPLLADLTLARQALDYPLPAQRVYRVEAPGRILGRAFPYSAKACNILARLMLRQRRLTPKG